MRAAAVSALAAFGAASPELQPRIVVLLRRALYDNDDEVRLWVLWGALHHRMCGV